jgi:tetratricopeptide (TPR) repeat protein
LKTTTSGGLHEIGTGMTERSLRFLFFFLILFLPCCPLFAAQVIVNSDDQFRYAEELMKRQDYPLAVLEFERFIHFFPEDEKVPEAKLLIGESYLNAKAYEQARKALEKVHREYPNRYVGGRALFLTGESYYRQGVYEEANLYFMKVRETFPQPQLRDAALYRLGWSQMQSRQWKEAWETFGSMDNTSPLYVNSQELAIRSREGEKLPYKSPSTAGALAALLPGSGHAYCDRYKDGIVAFLLNGLFTWAAIEAFDKDQDVLGGILTFLEIGWYSGNIYSAVNSAHKYNRALKDDYLKSLPELNFFSTSERSFGLSLRMAF